MSILPQTWRQWFGLTESAEVSDTPEGRYAALQEASGARHRSDTEVELKLKKKLPPRCVGCKRFMSKDEGMHILISGDWNLHTKCFERVVDRYLENGEVIDLTTGKVHKIDLEEENQ